MVNGHNDDDDDYCWWCRWCFVIVDEWNRPRCWIVDDNNNNDDDGYCCWNDMKIKLLTLK